MVRTAGYLFLLFLVDVSANVVADAMALVSRFGTSHPKSESPAEQSAHPASVHAATANSVQILVAVAVAFVCVFASAACAGVWWRTEILALVRPDGAGFEQVDGDSDSMESIQLNSDSV